MTPTDEGPLELEGGSYSVYWDKDAIEIRVNDYDAGPLRLSWETLRALEERARERTAPAPPRAEPPERHS